MKIQKWLAILLVLAMLFGMAACGASKEKVKSELIKEPWSYETSEKSYIDGYPFTTIDITEYNFSNSGTVGYYHRVTCYFLQESEDITKVKKNGTYTIEKDEIIVSYDDGQDDILKYEYKDGELKLYEELYDGTIVYYT